MSDSIDLTEQEEGLAWYPESGDDIDDCEPGKPLCISESESQTDVLKQAEDMQEQEAEKLYRKYEQECILDETKRSNPY